MKTSKGLHIYGGGGSAKPLSLYVIQINASRCYMSDLAVHMKVEIFDSYRSQHYVPSLMCSD
jgi:hypothetical protein